MRQYFEKIGDKRLDKEGIYIPMCLTRKKVYEIMTEDFYKWKDQMQKSSACHRVFSIDFKEVTIPKVKGVVSIV